MELSCHSFFSTVWQTGEMHMHTWVCVYTEREPMIHGYHQLGEPMNFTRVTYRSRNDSDRCITKAHPQAWMTSHKSGKPGTGCIACQQCNRLEGIISSWLIWPEPLLGSSAEAARLVSSLGGGGRSCAHLKIFAARLMKSEWLSAVFTLHILLGREESREFVRFHWQLWVVYFLFKKFFCRVECFKLSGNCCAAHKVRIYK